MTEQKKVLVLQIEVPEFFADDLDEMAGYISEPDPPDAEDRLYVVVNEWMRSDCGITIVSIPGDKCMNDDFEVAAFTGRVVGASTRVLAVEAPSEDATPNG